ncbi:MAG: DUF4177 domain-containing protein [Desulfobulbaceae bacterium]|nr:DUF4177 domain-containing protein [Desulfobulbaceae bacterium]
MKGIMRWGYKTIQYGLKKEGLLGSSFLDEAEVEQSLNEFGQAGWELVTLFGLQDGLMAVFKQPLDVKAELVQEPTQKKTTSPHRFSLNSRERHEPDLVVEHTPVSKRANVSKEVEEEEEGVGSIRIE